MIPYNAACYGSLAVETTLQRTSATTTDDNDGGSTSLLRFRRLISVKVSSEVPGVEGPKRREIGQGSGDGHRPAATPWSSKAELPFARGPSHKGDIES